LRSPLKFFLLVFALSIPFWMIGAVTDMQLLPGLPVSALAAFCPLMAALVLVYRETRSAGVIDLLRRAFDYRRIRGVAWYAPIFLLMPAVSLVAYGLMRLLEMPLPTPQFPVRVATLMFLAFLVAGMGEELGWSGYAIDPMQDRWSALQAGILLGLVGALWHIAPLPGMGGRDPGSIPRYLMKGLTGRPRDTRKRFSNRAGCDRVHAAAPAPERLICASERITRKMPGSTMQTGDKNESESSIRAGTARGSGVRGGHLARR
jgi:membrane protease YdiL (CAAX protease family)